MILFPIDIARTKARYSPEPHGDGNQQRFPDNLATSYGTYPSYPILHYQVQDGRTLENAQQGPNTTRGDQLFR